MTTANPDDATIRFSDRKIQTRASSTRPAAEQDWSGWEAWIESHKAQVLDVACQAAGEVIGVTAAGLEKRIKTLELELARANGVLDILKGKGAEGHKAEILDIVHQNVHQVAGELIRETTTPLENRLEALELRVAETRGAVDVLRGKDGAPDPEGPRGMLPIARVWTDGVSYAGEVVVYEGGTWQALKDTGHPPGNGKDWTLLAARGLDARSWRVRGTYNERHDYAELDVVVRDSSSFIALRDNPGACPGDGWQMIACGGKRGVAGDKGERGPAGPAGAAPKFGGARFNHNGMEISTDGGPIPILRSVSVDAADFSLKLTAPDGSTLKISLLPLFQAYNEQTRT
jgi:uncharacterized coiled-coil protein SlyX